MLRDPEALRYATGGLIPQIWWGDMKVLKDGTLAALTYPYYHASQAVPFTSAASYRSADHGRTWTKAGHILYEEADKRRDGFTEPAMEVLPDGEMLAVLRTGQALTAESVERSITLLRTGTRPTEVLTANIQAHVNINYTQNFVIPRSSNLITFK